METNNNTDNSTSNNITADKLIQGVAGQVAKQPDIVQAENNTTQKIRVLSVKYKIYTLGFVLLIAIFYGPFIDAYRRYNGVRTTIETAEKTIERNINKSTQYDKDISMINTIQKNLPEIVSCINTDQACDVLDEEITTNLATIKSYLQLNSLETEKMAINEKVILKNINEFLAQENPFNNQRIYNGNIQTITIGDVINEGENLNSFDLRIGMSFENKDALLKFVENIENHIFFNKTSEEKPLEYSMLYKIESMDYDVVNYKDEQEITIALQGFYFSN